MQNIDKGVQNPRMIFSEKRRTTPFLRKNHLSISTAVAGLTQNLRHPEGIR